MTITINAGTLALILLGLLAGTAVAALFERGRTADLWLRNTIIGILGAIVGSVIFDELDLYDDLHPFLKGEITSADVLVAIVGAAILMIVSRLVIRRRT